MRINELLVEEQVDEISLSGIGRGIGKAVGGVAKGVGAVAGGIAGIPGAVKKGFQAGKAVVGGDDEAPAQANAPAAAPASGGINYQSAVANKGTAAPTGSTTPPASTPPTAGNTATTPASTPAAPADDTADKGFGFDGNTGTPFASQEERTAWFKANGKIDPKAAVKTPPAGTPSAAGNTATPPAADPAATTAPSGGAPADATAPAKTGKVGVPAGKAAVDQAVGVVQSVRSDRRQDVVKYAKDKIDALQKAPAPAATPSAAPAATTPPPEEDNPNIVKGYNESVDRILYLTRVLNQAK